MRIPPNKTILFVLSVILLANLAGGEAARAAPLAYSNSAERPVFLGWPMPSYIGPARISQYPNSPWTWNYLGLNPDAQCPPAFGYLLNMDSRPAWRDTNLPEAQDMAQADPHNFEMVECYATEGEAGANGHEGTDIKAPAGTPILAAADGKVLEWRLSGLSNMLVLKHCVGGTWDASHLCIGGTQWYTTYMHINPDASLLLENKDIPAGTPLGTVYDQTINSHLHFEVGIGKRNYTNFVNPWGRDETPWLGCMWQDPSLCPELNPGFARLALYTEQQRLFVKQDGVNLVEIHAAAGVRKVQLAGQRIAVLDGNGILWVREGDYKRQLPFAHDFLSRWSNQGTEIVDFQLSPQRIARLDSNGILSAKQDSLDSLWSEQIRDISAFSLSDHRLGIVTRSGDLYIKQGDLTSGWTPLAGNVRAAQVVDNRVAYVDTQGRLLVNEGDLTAEWQEMALGVQNFQLTPLRVAILDAQGTLQVKEGNLRAPWIAAAENVRFFQVADYRLVILDGDGALKIREGNLYQPWVELPFGGVLVALTNTGAFVPPLP
jgi:murein DD-endopeptidase MepM/ murein hydrolase activator NlpD